VCAHKELTDAFVAASGALVGIAVHSVGAAPVEVTVPQFRLLVLVASDEQRTIGDIARHLGVNQSNASRHCDRIQRLGLAERRRSTEDARVVFVRLTPEGHALVDTVLQQRRVDIRRVVERLTPQDAAAALQALRAFNTAADELDEEQWPRTLQ